MIVEAVKSNLLAVSKLKKDPGMPVVSSSPKAGMLMTEEEIFDPRFESRSKKRPKFQLKP